MKRTITVEINTLMLDRLEAYCRSKGISRDFVLAVALDFFLDSEDSDALHSS